MLLKLICCLGLTLQVVIAQKALSAAGAVKTQPEFIGGASQFMAFIGKHYRYPPQLLRANVSGKTMVKFRVTSRGKVDSLTVLQSPGFGADEEMIRLLKLTSGRWKPGTINGKAVAMSYYLPWSINPE